MKTVGEWVDHIVSVHHGYLKRELPRLRIDLEELCVKYPGVPAWEALKKDFLDLKYELEIHLAKEEMMVFPSFRHLEECHREKTRPDLAKYDIRESLEQMEYEHDATRHFLESIDKNKALIASGPEARELFERLDHLKNDLQEHIHKEETGLFPEARFIYAELTQNILREE